MDSTGAASIGEEWQPALVYLTADTAPPKVEIEESMRAAERVRKKDAREFECYWLSWRHLYSVLQSNRRPLASDLLSMLDYLNLHFFNGFHWPEFPELNQWKFSVSPAKKVRTPGARLPIGIDSLPHPQWRFHA